MTQLNSTIFLKRLYITRDGDSVYDEAFHRGVNIIRGDNGSGKSTIANFIFYVLGGDFNRWIPEALSCDKVFAEIEFNEITATISRDISDQQRRPMFIYWGDLVSALSSNVEGWKIYQFQRSEKESFSQVLFRALSFPEVKGDAASNITMHQIFRVLYIDQLSAPDSLMRSEQFDAPIVRQAVGDLLFGIYDDILYSSEIKLRALDKQLNALESQYNSTVSVLGKSGIETSFEGVINEIIEKEKLKSKIEKEIETIHSDNISELRIKLDADIEKKQRNLVEKRVEHKSISEDILRLSYEVEDSKLFLESIVNRMFSLEDSITTRRGLGELPITHCPHCLQELDGPKDINICIVCKKQMPGDLGLSQAMRMLQELEHQKNESLSLIKQKIIEIEKFKMLLADTAVSINDLQESINDYFENVQSSRNQYLEELFNSKGRISAELSYLLKHKNSLEILEKLKNNIAELNGEIAKTKSVIKERKYKQIVRKNESDNKIKEFAIKMLKSDIPTEEVFQSANDINIDFEHNTFSVNERNQFSASSIVYLKNTILFSMFFASLDLGYFRYPRFILCDNTEDKGMQEIRSHRFQKNIIEFSEKHDTIFQIIYTTSKINPEYNNEKYCVGKYYTKNNKSLKV